MGFKLSNQSNEQNFKLGYRDDITVNDISDSIKIREIYLYNVSQMEHKISRPPNFPQSILKPCPPDKDYVLVGTLGDPATEFLYNMDDGQRFISYVDGIREVSRLLNSHNPTTKALVRNTDDVIKAQDFTLNSDNFVNDNYNALGLFWSFNNPPTQKEVNAAIARLEKAYRNELARMARIELTSPKDCLYEANNISRAAVVYFDESTSWHNTKFSKAATKVREELTYKDCPDCGFNDIPEKAKKCWHCSHMYEELVSEKKKGKV